MKRLSLIIASYYEAIITPNRFTRKEPQHPQKRCGIAFPEETSGDTRLDLNWNSGYVVWPRKFPRKFALFNSAS